MDDAGTPAPSSSLRTLLARAVGRRSLSSRLRLPTSTKRAPGLCLKARAAESIMTLQTDVGCAGSTITASLPGTLQAVLLPKVQTLVHTIAGCGAGGGAGAATATGAGCNRITCGCGARGGAGARTGSGAGTISTAMQSASVTPASLESLLLILILQPASRSFMESKERASSISWQFLSSLLPPIAKPNAAP